MATEKKNRIERYSIKKTGLTKLLMQLCEEQKLVAPVKNDVFGDIDFAAVTTIDDVCFEYTNTVNPPKELFFPNSECMFAFEPGDNASISLQSKNHTFVVFGLRSCDVKAIELLDGFYERDFEDSYYLNRREQSVLISLACWKLDEQCFCTSTHTGPILDDGFDIQLIETGDGYVAEIGSTRGVEFVEAYKRFFQNTADFDRQKFLAGVENSEPRFNLANVCEHLRSENVAESFWEDMAGRCQSCGLCLFMCPTCSCFTVTDKALPSGRWRRVRQWDGCYFRGFTRMTGGHDPVRHNTEMMKRKYEHKLVQQIDEFGMCGCTGCGRCNLVCVGNVNWLENIEKIDREA
jgi:ferredoxin